jgi:hypothetical protein
MKTKKRKKPATCPRHVLRLYMAVANYLEKCGGKAVLSSGITIIQWPSDRPGQFTVGVKVLGRKPRYSEGSPSSDGDEEQLA